MVNARFIIFLFFLIRLYGITNPPLERNHNWRQVTTNMYARNFLEVDNNIMYARVDMAGDLSGITAKEFPIFNYLIYLVADVFGWEHWYGRLISLIVSSFGVWFFYRLVREYVSDKLDYPAMLLLLVSIWFGHSRIIMPDTFAVSLVLGGLYFGFHYLEKGKWWRLGLFSLFATLGALAKLPAGYLLAVLIFPLLQLKTPTLRKAGMLLMGGTLLVTCGWWYFRWLPHMVETYGFEHYPMRSILTGMKEIFADLPETFERFYISAPKGYIFFAMYLAGLIFLFWKRPRKLFIPFLVLSGVFLAYMFKAGQSFYHHNYYIIPFAPVMALIAAYGINQLSLFWKPEKFHRRLTPGVFRKIILLTIVIESVANQQDAFRIRPSELPKLQLETIADSVSYKNDLIAINQFDGNPQEMYFTHRKGWVLTNDELANPSVRATIQAKGCRYIFINKEKWGENAQLPENTVFENEYYRVYKLTNLNE